MRHENVVQVYEVGEQPLPYLVMEFIPGETLQQRLDRTGPLDVAEVVRIGRQIAEGLAAAHANDLIHRDIKPAQHPARGRGRSRVKITDFGLARAADDASISQSGVIAGTPMYMAPEQALGDKLDQRADLFSLGSVLYQMAAGRPPFRANSTLAVLKRVAEDTPRPIREIIPETPQWLCDIIAKLHAKNPDDRFQSAREVADVLADCEAQLKANPKLKDFSRIPRGKVLRTGRRIWVAAAAVVLLPVLALAASEFAGVTNLFSRPPATTATGPEVTEPFSGPPATTATGPKSAGIDEQPPAPEIWTPLFNGTDLTGWKTHPEQAGQWEVKDGVLIGGPSPSHLFTVRGDYADFHLRAEVKLNAGGDSGIRFRLPALDRVDQPGKVARAGGYEAEFTRMDNASARTGSVWRLNQAGPASVLFRAPAGSLTRPDEWCTYEVIADGNRIVTRINGAKVANCIDPQNTYTTGHIALQCFRPQTVVHFRKVEIKELPPAGRP